MAIRIKTEGVGCKCRTWLNPTLKRVPSRFSDVFFVDASSTNTINIDLENIAQAKEIGESPQDSLTWLARQREEWLVLFNNADYTTLNLHDFFPNCSHGNILVTSRNRDMCTHAPSPESNHKVSNLLPDDARHLLLSMAGHGNGHSNETEVAIAIVKVKYQHSDAVALWV
jgi:hypothetical protein